MKTSKATTKILAIAATLIIATTLIIAPALTALAANSSPHPVPVRKGPMWIIYNENNYNKLIYLFPNSEYHKQYVEETLGAPGSMKRKKYEKQGITEASITCFRGDFLRPGDNIPDSVVYTDMNSIDTIIDPVAQQAMYDAQKEIAQSGNNPEKLNPEVAVKAQEKGFAPENTTTVLLFDLTYYFVNPHFKPSNDYRLVHASLEMKDLSDSFVCLLHRQNGVWNVVENATVVGDRLTFEVNSLSPFTLVINGNGSIMDSGAKQAPKTGDNTLTWAATAIGGLMLILGAGYVLIRKKNA